MDSLRTLYVKRPVLLRCAERIANWAADIGFTTISAPHKMHATIAFSRQAINWSRLPADQGLDPIDISLLGRSVGLHAFGAVALAIESPMLLARWHEFCDAGAVWDYPPYQAHITVAQLSDGALLEGVEPFSGELLLGPEVRSEIPSHLLGKLPEQRKAASI
jgi:hypothetical protein